MTWQEPQVVISTTPFDPNNRPYVKYASDGKKRIDLVFTDGHPRIEEHNGVYHCYYQAGAFWRSDGSKICDEKDLPFAPHQATQIYKPSFDQGRAWLADVTLDKKGRPFILYTRHPSEVDHRYHYAWYDANKNEWIDREICKAGKWFPQTQPGEKEREEHYHGNLTIHPTKTNTIYLSRQINGRFEIEKRTTRNKGRSWKIEPITSNSEFDHVRPYVPRHTPKNSPTVLLWMENKKYIHYTNFDTRIRYWIDR